MSTAISLWALVAVAQAEAPIRGTEVAALASFDQAMQGMLAEWEIPGATLAIARGKKLVFSRGYGLADAEKPDQPMGPGQPMRIASISKPLSATVALRLAQRGELDLDAPALAMLDPALAPLGGDTDPRMAQITVRDLLQHSGGWDRSLGGDPMFPPFTTDATQGTGPADCAQVIRYWRSRPLDHAPGQTAVYSNFGYCVLGRVLEAATGQDYGALVQDELAAADFRVLSLGRSLVQERLPGEPRYHPYPGQDPASSVFDPAEAVPWPDGGFYLEGMDSHGGWVSSAPDLVRFAQRLDRRGCTPGLLRRDQLAQAIAAPDLPAADTDRWYGLGWNVRAVAKGHNLWHTGSLPGSVSLLVRRADGIAWAALFNGRPKDWRGFIEALDAGLWRASDAVERWPRRAVR